MHEVLRHRRKGDLELGPEDGTWLLPSEAPSNLLIERVPKTPDAIRLYVHSRRRAVPAKATQVLPAGLDRGEEIESRNRPRATPPLPVRNGDQDRWAMNPLDDPRGYDTDHTRVPPVPLENDAEILGGVERPLQLVEGLS